MKTPMTLALGALLALSLAACAATPSPTPTPSVVGTWVGDYTNGSNPQLNDYAMIVNADGTIKVYDGTIADGAQATGTWTYTGGHLKGTYSYSGKEIYSLDATFSTPNHVTGTWGDGNAGSGEGTVDFDRQ